MRKNIIWIVGIVAVAGISFYGGMSFAGTRSGAQGGTFQNMTSEQRQQAFQQFRGGTGGSTTGRRNGPDGSAGGLFVSGEIIGSDNTSITIKLPDGGSRIVLLSGSTAVGKIVDGEKTDLTLGMQVAVNGSSNSDGSVTAQSIQIRPNILQGRTATTTQR